MSEQLFERRFCVWEGDLSLTLNINGRVVTLNDHDARKNTDSILELEEHQYTLRGWDRTVENRSRDDTYLILSVQRCPIARSRPTNTKAQPSVDDHPATERYRLGEVFTVKLPENAGTGYQWQVELSPGWCSSIRSMNRTVGDETRCGGHQIWHLRGTERGERHFTGRYRRSWEHREVVPKVLTFQVY